MGGSKTLYPGRLREERNSSRKSPIQRFQVKIGEVVEEPPPVHESALPHSLRADSVRFSDDLFSVSVVNEVISLHLILDANSQEISGILNRLYDVRETFPSGYDWRVRFSGDTSVPIQLIGFLYAQQQELLREKRTLVLEIDHSQNFSDDYLVNLLEKFTVKMLRDEVDRSPEGN
ncbi:hypothetical protein MRY87_04575 [bacterium]|nr:hypothetical protein [bacterium]